MEQKNIKQIFLFHGQEPMGWKKIVHDKNMHDSMTSYILNTGNIWAKD